MTTIIQNFWQEAESEKSGYSKSSQGTVSPLENFGYVMAWSKLDADVRHYTDLALALEKEWKRYEILQLQYKEQEAQKRNEERKLWREEATNAINNFVHLMHLSFDRLNIPVGVGSDVKVFWKEDNDWYDGSIVSYDPITDVHSVLYFDGEHEDLKLKDEIFKIVSYPKFHDIMIDQHPVFDVIISDQHDNHQQYQCNEEFSLPMEITLAPPPYHISDFDIPDGWKPCSNLNFTPFKLIAQNSYHGGKVPRPLIDPEATPTCTCVPTVGGCHEDSFCTNRMLYMECALNCPSLIPGCIGYCSNTVIQRRAFPVTKVFKSRCCGYGLKIMENVKPGRIVAEYLGQVVTCDEGKRRMATYEEYDDFYFMSLGNGLMLDAKSMGSDARFINHCCDPNCVLQKWNVLGETRLVIVADKFIRSGEEITYNYNYYEDDLGSIPRQVCMCGSDNCSGTIGGRKTDSAGMVWIEKAILILNSSRRYTIEVAEQHLHLWHSIKKNRHNEGTRYDTTKFNCKTIQKFNGKQNRIEGHLESINFHEISMATEILEPLEYRKLHSAVENAKAWKVRVDTYLNQEKGKCYRLYKAKVFKNLLLKAPLCLKLEEHVDIENKLKACNKVERHWSTRLEARNMYQSSGSFNFNDIYKSNIEVDVRKLVSRNENSTSSLPFTRIAPHTRDVRGLKDHVECTTDAKFLRGYEFQKVSVHDQLGFLATEIPCILESIKSTCTWREWISIIKDLRDLAPVYCPVAPYILNMYKEICIWANKKLSPYYIHNYQEMKKAVLRDCRSKGDSRRNLGYWIRSVWPILQDLGLMYKITLEPSFLILCDLLENNLQMCALRKELAMDSVNVRRHDCYISRIPEHQRTYIGMSEACHQGENWKDAIICKGKYVEKEREHVFVGGENEDKTNVQNSNCKVEMDLCNELESLKSRSDGEKDRKLFCFCWLPEHISECTTLVQCDDCEEWYHIACMNLQESDFKIGRQTVKFKCPVCQMGYGEINPFLLAALSEWDIHSHKHVISFNNKSDIERRTIGPVNEGNESLPENGDEEKKIKEVSRENFSYMTMQFFGHVVAEAQKYLPFDTPLTFLFTTMSTFVSAWDLVAKNTIENYVLLYERNRSIDDRRRKRKSFFIDFLRLYYNLRIIRVRPQRVNVLRRLIWDMSFDALFKVSYGNIETFGKLYSHSDICSILDAGRTFYDSCGQYTGLSYCRLPALIRLHFNHEQFLSRAKKMVPLSKHDSPSGWTDCHELIRNWEESLGDKMKLEDCDAYIRLKSMWAIHIFEKSGISQNEHTFLDLRESTPPDNADVGKEKSIEVLMERWCWCLGTDDGTPMICCDGCEYWYHTSCVKYTVPKKRRTKNQELHQNEVVVDAMDTKNLDFQFDQPFRDERDHMLNMRGSNFETTEKLRNENNDGEKMDSSITVMQSFSKKGRKIKLSAVSECSVLSSLNIKLKSRKRKERDGLTTSPLFTDDETGKYFCVVCRERNMAEHL